MNVDIQALNERIKKESEFVEKITTEVGRVIVGQKYMIERLLIGLLCNGHVHLEGVPGLAKTLAVKTLSGTIQTKFQRIQFTPDLMPSENPQDFFRRRTCRRQLGINDSNFHIMKVTDRKLIAENNHRTVHPFNIQSIHQGQFYALGGTEIPLRIPRIIG